MTLAKIIIALPQDLLDQIDQARPAGQPRSEWIREAIRQRLNAYQLQAHCGPDWRQGEPDATTL